MTEGAEVNKELGTVPEILTEKILPAVEVYRAVLEESHVGDHELVELGRFSREEFKRRVDSLGVEKEEKKEGLTEMLRLYGKNPRAFTCAYKKEISVAGGAEEVTWTLRNPGDPQELPTDPNQTQLQLGFIYEKPGKIESKEEMYSALGRSIPPEKALELYWQQIPGERVIIFTAGVYKGAKGLRKTDYLAGVEIICSPHSENCPLPRGVIFSGRVPHYSDPLPGVNLSRREFEILVEHLRVLPKPPEEE